MDSKGELVERTSPRLSPERRFEKEKRLNTDNSSQGRVSQHYSSTPFESAKLTWAQMINA
jgi:hypothetical protein